MMPSWVNRRAHDVGRECLLLVPDKEARHVEFGSQGFCEMCYNDLDMSRVA